jgi:hypothetical protein
MRYVTGRQVRRKGASWDICAKRKREIVLHARLVGAADTADLDRWLIAWVWHNRKATDQIWSVMEAAKRMGGKVTEAEASAIIEEASITRKHKSADDLARFLGVTYEQRQKLCLSTIGSINVGKRARKELRKRRWRLNAERRRRGRGMRPQSQSLSRLKPWEAKGMSRAKWYRQNKGRRDSETTSSTPIFLISEVEPVSTGSAEGVFDSSKEVRGLPSSQTVTLPAVDRLPVELRLLALGLPLPDDMQMAA